MTDSYRPIACSLHDELESLATRGRECEIRYRPAEREEEIVTRGRIVDIYARGGAEYLRLDDGSVIRLDRIISVDGTVFPPAC